jgi:hypothetical protein
MTGGSISPTEIAGILSIAIDMIEFAGKDTIGNEPSDGGMPANIGNVATGMIDNESTTKENAANAWNVTAGTASAGNENAANATGARHRNSHRAQVLTGDVIMNEGALQVEGKDPGPNLN